MRYGDSHNYTQWRLDQNKEEAIPTETMIPDTIEPELVAPSSENPSEPSSEPGSGDSIVTVAVETNVITEPSTCNGKPCIGLDKSAASKARMKIEENKAIHESSAMKPEFFSVFFFILAHRILHSLLSC